MGRGKSITAFKMEQDKLIEQLHFMLLGMRRDQSPCLRGVFQAKSSKELVRICIKFLGI